MSQENSKITCVQFVRWELDTGILPIAEMVFVHSNGK